MRRLELIALDGIPEIRAGDDLVSVVVSALSESGIVLSSQDVLVVAQKIVSKAEGRSRLLSEIQVSSKAAEIAVQCGKDARKVQAILDESTEIVRVTRSPPDGLIIARHRHGWVCANAGIDESNLGPELEGHLLLLPENPDQSARQIGLGLKATLGVQPGVIITDTFGRPWRRGLVNVAIGSFGVAPVISWVGNSDAYGRKLEVSEQALADEVAAAVGLVMKKDAGVPVAIVRGLSWQFGNDTSARDYVRPPEKDLFR